ncbi:hypothetical protein [Candidatus Manganitrophus noduliformans]|uniref:Uncharacterized protein n=1 Tax=Candidatus Manganitrophus noduliformans TaxID=2606439 RepID=A0A7X6DT22_9BACT|nr:hypothetical protein [Candidatus Manganitrophus noduliformans]NKE72857.1 hypothetical protein [Candidatus Manganitrophus noduliformans]
MAQKAGTRGVESVAENHTEMGMGKPDLKALFDLARRCGLAGRRVYIPKYKFNDSPDDRLETLIGRCKPPLLREIEHVYERDHITFYFEHSPRALFSSRFGKNKTAARFGLKIRTAARTSSAAWRAWRDWFGHRERRILEQLRDLADENGGEHEKFSATYLEIRGQIRSGQEVDMEHHAGYHNVSREIILQVVDLAKASIESCPWRLSPNDG